MVWHGGNKKQMTTVSAHGYHGALACLVKCSNNIKQNSRIWPVVVALARGACYWRSRLIPPQRPLRFLPATLGSRQTSQI